MIDRVFYEHSSLLENSLKTTKQQEYLKNNSFILRKVNYILIILNNMMNLQAHVSIRMIKGAGKIVVTI